MHKRLKMVRMTFQGHKCKHEYKMKQLKHETKLQT